jgi:SAM-dependent methyltransferase/peptidoglycan/xylan/chitin deacetylase (PgdA/CDA1 family)
MTQDAMRLGRPAAASPGLLANRIAIPPVLLRFGLTAAKYLGLFRIARYVSRNGLRIICYHGFAVADEYKFRSKLFIRGELFRRRIEYLRRKRYPILPLGEAVQALGEGRLPPCATVVTMDDGWRGTYCIGLPLIQEFRIPVTLYVSTYYIEHPMPVFPVALSYLFWRTTASKVELPRGLGTYALSTQAEEADAAAEKFGARLPPADRLCFLREVAKALDVSYDEIENQQLFLTLDEQQLRELAEAGVDIQLHSHRHEWPLDDRNTVEREIGENRRFLERLVTHPLEHFCYPSGVFGLHQGEWLAALGVRSATTIEPGLNYPETSPFALRRLMDGHPVSDVDFEAEISGFMEIVRALRYGYLFSMLQRRFWSHQGSSGSSTQNNDQHQQMGRDIGPAIGQQGSEFYDRLHAESNTPDIGTMYYPLLRKVVSCTRDHGSRSILEVGCGNGFLAEMILREYGGRYRGFDFSPVAVRNASQRTGRHEIFFCGDALDAGSYAGDYDTIVCTEVLEHIDADLDVVRLWRGGTWCVCSVPNFDYPSHVRFFHTSEAVTARYGQLVDIRGVVKVARPLIPDRRITSYLRNLRWSRDDPSRLLGFLGIQTFDRLGGWFLFYGIRRLQDS